MKKQMNKAEMKKARGGFQADFGVRIGGARMTTIPGVLNDGKRPSTVVYAPMPAARLLDQENEPIFHIV